MDAEKLHALLTAKTFKPFRIATSRSVKVSIGHRNDAILMRTALIAVESRGSDGIAESVLTLPLKQIVSVDAE